MNDRVSFKPADVNQVNMSRSIESTPKQSVEENDPDTNSVPLLPRSTTTSICESIIQQDNIVSLPKDERPGFFKSLWLCICRCKC